MSLIVVAAILATQDKFPDVADTHWAYDSVAVVEQPVQNVTPSKARLDEIWDHVDNRVTAQLDLWFNDGYFPNVVSFLKVEYAYDPDNEDTMTNLGWMQENIDQKADAEATYKDYIAKHPANADASYSLAFMYFNTNKDYAGAVRVLEPTLKNKPKPNSYRILAKAYEKMGKLHDSLRVYELYLKNYPGDGAAEMNIKRVKAKIQAGGK